MTSLFNKNSYSKELYEETEKPYQGFTLETHQIIKHRYEFASEFCKSKRVLEVGAEVVLA